MANTSIESDRAPPSIQSEFVLFMHHFPCAHNSESDPTRGTRYRRHLGLILDNFPGGPSEWRERLKASDVLVFFCFPKWGVTMEFDIRLPLILLAMATPPHTAQTTIDRLEPWKDDGNIVLAAEGKYFRVRRSVLSAHSEVFKDMFTCPHSPEAETDLVDHCPVIHLQDAATDVQIVLKALYDRSFPSLYYEKMPLSIITAFLRLGEKYEIPALLKEGKARLCYAVDPTALSSASVTLPDLFPAVLLSDSDPHHFQLLNPLQEKELMTPLPLVTYQAIIDCSLGDILDGYAHKGSFYSLSPANLRSSVRMKHVLERYRPQLVKTLCSSPVCDHPVCLAQTLRMWAQETDAVSPIRPWNLQWDSMFCRVCLPTLKGRHEAEMKQVWDQIPTAFGFASWREVRMDGNSPSLTIMKFLQR